MTQINISRQIAAPRELVFEVCSDFPNAAETIAAINRIEMLTEGPVGLGTRFKESRTLFGREATEEMEVIEFVPPQQYTLGANTMGARFETTFRFTDEGHETQVEIQMQVTPESLFSKIMSPLNKVMMGSIKKFIESDLDSIESAVKQRLSLRS